MGWTEKYKKSIDCDNPKGFSQRAHCQGRKKKMNEDLRNWFDPNHPEGGWKRYNTKGEAIGPCAREPGEPKPKCLSNEKAAKLLSQKGAKGIASAVRRKRKKDPVANRRGKGGKPKMVSNKIEENALNYDWDTPIRERADRYCPKCEKLELRHECKYGPRYWDMFSLPAEVIANKKDYKVTMPYSGPDAISSPQPLSTNQMKYNIATVHPANESKEPDHEYSMIRSELSTIQNAVKRLRKRMKGEGNVEAWVQSKITKAADYIDTAADYVNSGEHNVEESCWTGYKQVGMKKKGKKIVPNCVPEEVEYIEEKNKPTNPELWSRAKSLARKKFDVYPSAYANGWAAKWYKSKGGGWKSVSEEVGFTIPNAKSPYKFPILPKEKGDEVPIRLIKKSGPGPQLPLAKKKTEVQLAHYEYSNWREELGLNEDWQKVNRQDKTDGLSQAAVDAYRRENPGSKLQTAVTEKKPKGKRAKRRENFCRRMKGMKSKLTSAKTAKDPDSRINKALRRWRCR